jgi:hypothetical protein
LGRKPTSRTCSPFLFDGVVEKSVVSIRHALDPDVFRPQRDMEARSISGCVPRAICRISGRRPQIACWMRSRLGAHGRLKVTSDKRVDRAAWSKFHMCTVLQGSDVVPMHCGPRFSPVVARRRR